MSCNETKKVLRVEIPWLRGKGYNEAYKYFRSILGPADEVDRDKNETYYFYYEPNSHYYVPVKEYSERNTNNYRWGIDIILYEKNDYGEVRGKKDYSPQEIQISAAKWRRSSELAPVIAKFTNIVGITPQMNLLFSIRKTEDLLVRSELYDYRRKQGTYEDSYEFRSN